MRGSRGPGRLAHDAASSRTRATVDSDHREAGVGDRGVDHLARRAAGVAGVEREQDALEGRLRGERVAERDAAARRRLVRVAVDVAQAADRLAGGGEARRGRGSGRSARSRSRARRSRRGLTRVDVARARAPTAPSCRAGSSRAPRRRSAHSRAAISWPSAVAQVQRHRALVARQDRPPQRVVVVAQAAPVAHRVAAPAAPRP